MNIPLKVSMFTIAVGVSFIATYQLVANSNDVPRKKIQIEALGSASSIESFDNNLSEISPKSEAVDLIQQYYGEGWQQYETRLTVAISLTTEEDRKENDLLNVSLNAEAYIRADLTAPVRMGDIYFNVKSLHVSGAEGAVLSSEGEKNIREDLQNHFRFELEPQGQISRFLVSKGDSDLSIKIKRIFLSRLQFTVNHNASDAWAASESDESGLYIAKYSEQYNRENINIIKTDYDYQSLIPLKQRKVNDTEQNESSVKYTLDTVRALKSLNAESLAKVNTNRFLVSTSAKLNLDWTQSSAPRAPIPNKLGWLSLTLSETIPQPSSPTSLAQGEVTLKEFSISMAAYQNGLQKGEFWRQREKFINALNNDPSLITDILGEITSQPSQAKNDIYLGVLLDSGSPEAQRALMEVGSNDNLPLSLRQHAISHGALLKDPSPEVAESLSGLMNDDSLDQNLRGAARVALGAVSKAGLDRGESAEFQQAVTSLEAGLLTAEPGAERLSYVAALGNAGQSSSTALLMDIATFAEEHERAAAVDALRFNSEPGVDEYVSELIRNEKNDTVKLSAIRSAVYREPSSQIDSALIYALTHEVNSDLRLEAISSIEFLADKNPELLNALEQSSVSDTNAEVKQRASQVLKSLQASKT